MRRQAYLAGQRASRRLEPPVPNPYGKKYGLCYEWEQGWCDERTAMVKEGIPVPTYLKP